jgi:rSAM/selenodomain-associated transferase 2
MLVSIIIPTLNEVETIDQCCTSVASFADVECILADGGSTDGTQQVLERVCNKFTNVRWLQTERGRSRQMNAAARIAHGDWFIFLHADTVLPETSYQRFRDEISRTKVNAGAFSFKIAHQHLRYRYLEWYVAQRCRFLKLPFGDQAIFARKDVFTHLEGYREDFPLMEDFDFVQRAKKSSVFKVIDAHIFTSARRYEAEGYWKRAAGNVYLQLLFRFGVHPKRLAAKYYKEHF